MIDGMTSDLILTLADESALPALTSLYDAAARWMLDNGIDQWQPGGKDAEHFRLRMKEGEVWLARTGRGAVVGAYELWWQDEAAWGARGPEAGYVHRLMVDRTEAPRGTGQALLAHAERRIAESGRALSPARLPLRQRAAARLLRGRRVREGRRAAREDGRGRQPLRGHADGEGHRIAVRPQLRCGATILSASPSPSSRLVDTPARRPTRTLRRRAPPAPGSRTPRAPR